jgi:hypothetical protein
MMYEIVTVGRPVTPSHFDERFKSGETTPNRYPTLFNRKPRMECADFSENRGIAFAILIEDRQADLIRLNEVRDNVTGQVPGDMTQQASVV